MENVRYGAHKHQASEMEELKSCAWQHFHTQRKFQQIHALPAFTLKLVNVSPLCMTQELFKLLPLHWDLEQVSFKGKAQ